MRTGHQRTTHAEDEESAFVSMTDMTVSFLLIVILLLAFFASQYSEKGTVPRSRYDARVAEVAKLEDDLVIKQAEINAKETEIKALTKRIAELEELLSKLKKYDPLEAYLTITAIERRKILETLQEQLKIDFPDLQVVISEESDALRFQGDGLFSSGSSELRSDRRAIVESIATRLDKILPCYTVGIRSVWSAGCNSSGAIIEAVQIEGHTDADGGDISNLVLSTDRANSTFTAMIAQEADLVDHLNFRKQPVLSVAGYGKMRPIAANNSEESKATNRRIDLRIIMYTPSRSEEIALIRDALNKQLDGGGVQIEP
jgi:flagellar motor protein MotB